MARTSILFFLLFSLLLSLRPTFGEEVTITSSSYTLHAISKDQKVSTTTIRRSGARCERPAAALDRVVFSAKVTDGIDRDIVFRESSTVSSHLGSDRLLAGLSEGMEGMCVGETRAIVSPNNDKGYNAGDASALREPLLGDSLLLTVQTTVVLLYIEVTLTQLVSPEHFKVFECLNTRNNRCALSIIKDPAFDMSIVDAWHNTPLMSAISSGMFQVVAVLLNSRPLADTPLTAYLDSAKPSGHRAIIYAVQHADLSILKSLLKRGADPNVALAPEIGGWTPMHFAASLGPQYKGHLKLLLEYGGDPYAVNAASESILDVSDKYPTSWRPKVVALLNDAIDVLDEREEEEEEEAAAEAEEKAEEKVEEKVAEDKGGGEL